MFVDKLKALKKNLKQSSIDTYLRNIKRLRKVHHDLPIPDNAKWVKEKKLLDWYDKQPLNVRRHMATAATVVLQVFKTESKPWKERQKSSMKEFDSKRRERKLSDKQKDKIPAKGFKALKIILTVMKKELGHILKKDPNTWTKPEMLRVQDLIIISLYNDHPLRLDYATLKIGKSPKNCIFKNMSKPRGWHVQLVEFKTGKSLGKQVFKLNTANQRLLNKFIPAVQNLTEHNNLLTNQSGGKMSKQVLSKRLMLITKKRIGKSFSVQLLRILFAMQNRQVLETAKEVSDKLMHSTEQSLMYSKKD